MLRAHPFLYGRGASAVLRTYPLNFFSGEIPLLQVMGYVPQDDLMYTDLTVEELLLFSACMRLPAAASSADHRRHVEHAIKVLQEAYAIFVNLLQRRLTKL